MRKQEAPIKDQVQVYIERLEPIIEELDKSDRSINDIPLYALIDYPKDTSDIELFQEVQDCYFEYTNGEPIYLTRENINLESLSLAINTVQALMVDIIDITNTSKETDYDKLKYTLQKTDQYRNKTISKALSEIFRRVNPLSLCIPVIIEELRIIEQRLSSLRRFIMKYRPEYNI